MAPASDSGRAVWWRRAVPVLAAAFLFNLGQGVLRPTMPLYLQEVFSANYRMVTAIPTVFGAGKWVASLPTGYLLDRLGRRPLMMSGLLLIASSDVASVMTVVYAAFLGFRALAGVGWAMFGTVATTTMVDLPAVERRGRAVSLLLMSETLGLLLGTAAGGWLYQGVGVASPFVFEAACMLVATALVARWAVPASRPSAAHAPRDWRPLGAVLRTPGVLVMSVTNAALTAIQTGVLVFLFPLYLVNRGGLRPEAVGLLTSLGVLGRLLALWFAGSASDRRGRMRALVPGLLVYAEHLARIREEEQRNAARVLGVERVEFLGYEDGEVEDTRSLRLDITRQIRRWRPDLIITQHPERTYTNFFGWHRDHRITAGVVLDCVYPLARDHLSFPELLPDHEPHKVREVYLVRWEQPLLAVDITDTMDQKLQAVACHASQVSDWKSVEARVRARAAALGAPTGYTYAEGFDHVVLQA